jgi:hypothetical protein
MRDTSAIGNRTAGIVLAALLQAGQSPLLPFGEGHCADTQQVYLVPVDDVADRGANLRVDAPRNNQVKGVRWAKDCVIQPR